MTRMMTTATTATVAVAALVGVAAALLIGPRPPSLEPGTGDAGLTDRASQALGTRGHDQVAVALIDGDRTTYAGFGGAGPATTFEIGSVSKALTGMLLADLAQDGDVRLDQPVGELVPGTALSIGRATLQELSQHRSGLPRLPTQPTGLVRNALSQISGANPYRGGPVTVLDLAGEAGADGGAEPAYSNLGVSALGDALAIHAGTSYQELLTTRLLAPLGMRATTIATSPADVPGGHAIGRSATSGRELDPWIAEGWAPAGVGSWSTAEDLARLARGVLDGTAPGASAADATTDYTAGKRIGLGWITSTENDRPITWHNGATSGFRSFVGLDRERGRAIVVLSASTKDVDDAAIDLLTESTESTEES